MAQILIVDDSHTDCMVVKEMLADTAHSVTVARTGRDALGALRVAPVDVVITDLFMPDLDGFDVMRGGHEIRPATRFILMSSNPSRCHVFAMARPLGAVRLLQKPFSKTQLLGALDTALAAVAAASSPALAGDAKDVASQRR